ncbi:alpha-amidating enzyme precursor 2 [Biomphalaria glabrata]|nr:alpha-amidating enzyme precursor 2 [Biomphalaria glabrata]
MNHPVDFEDTQILKILMLGASPRKPDSYLCTAYHAQDLESYIYKFEAPILSSQFGTVLQCARIVIL